MVQMLVGTVLIDRSVDLDRSDNTLVKNDSKFQRNRFYLRYGMLSVSFLCVVGTLVSGIVCYSLV